MEVFHNTSKGGAFETDGTPLATGLYNLEGLAAKTLPTLLANEIKLVSIDNMLPSRSTSLFHLIVRSCTVHSRRIHRDKRDDKGVSNTYRLYNGSVKR